MSIRKLLIAESIVFLLLLVVTLVATLGLVGSGGGDALYINVAGRQRMLSQKTSKEALEYARESTPERREQLEKTIQLFSVSHRALRTGGQTPLSLDGGNPAQVTGASDAKLIALLDEVDAGWRKMSGAAQSLIKTASARREAIETIKKKNTQVLENMDIAVRYYAAERDVSSRVVNIAGRQRMLSQRTALQALLYDAEPAKSNLSALTQSIDIFTRSHRALLAGGDAPLKLSGGRTVRLPANSTARIVDKMGEVNDLWGAQTRAINVLTQQDSGFHQALKTITDMSPTVLKKMNAAVFRSQKVAEAKLETLQQLQIAAVVVGIILALLSIVLAVSIGQALVRLRESADKISTGQVAEELEPMGIGELKELSQSFERMRFSLQATMEMLDKDQEQGEDI